MENCIFCKIAKGEIPSYKVYEDDDFLAFLDNYPLVVGHTLVIPKKHSRWVWDLDTASYSALTQKVKIVADALRKAFGTEFVSEGIVGEDVPHTHIHVMPRKIGDGFGGFPTQKLSPKPTDEEFKKTAERIKLMLSLKRFPSLAN